MAGIKKKLLVAGIFLLQGFFMSAQITISLDKDTIGFSESVVVHLSGEVRDLSTFAELPHTDGLQIVGRTRNYSFTGSGKVKFTQTFTLSPYKVGTFTIGPAWVQAGGTRLFSNKVTLVIKAGTESSVSKEIFMRCEPDKKKAVVGEQITLSIRIYHRIDWLSGEERPLAKTFNGFWYHEGSPSETYKDSVVLLNGVVYRVKTIYKEYVFPNTAGQLKIPPYEYACFVKQNPFPTGDPMIDGVMGIQMPVQLVSPEVPIDVSPLPENKPGSFSGDVGTFALSAAIDKENIKAYEAVKLTVTISGKGNISFIQLPPLNFPEGMETYPPVSNDSAVVGTDGIEGQKTFTLTLIAKKPGAYTLPGISFSYFDPKQKEYVTVTTPEFKLNVAPGDPPQEVSENNLPDSFLFGPSYGKLISRILWIGVPAVLLMLLLYYRSQQKKKAIEKEEIIENNADLPIEIQEPAIVKPDVYSMTAIAERFFINGSIQSGISQLYETLLSAVLFKTELSREEASVHQLRYRLGMKKLSQELIADTMSLLEELGAQRYSLTVTDSSTLSENLQKTRRLSVELIS